MIPVVAFKTRTLDHQLTEVDLQLASAPLAIRRFTEHMTVERPTLAMKRATDETLSIYAKCGSDQNAPVSVTKLCEICGIALHGRKPAPSKGPFYSVENYKSWRGHTGNLFFHGHKASIRIPYNLSHGTARISVAHEIGHLLIHRRASGYDEATLRLPSSIAEEALAEYGARLLLMPSNHCRVERENLAEYALMQSSRSRVTLHSAVTRLGDPDIASVEICGAILWRMNGHADGTELLNARLTPQWHLCPREFVPVGKCKARLGSLVAELAQNNKPISGSRVEEVNIGSFNGRFRVDACAWGSVDDGTKLVLSVFRDI
jgi:hypothetical protein